MKKGFTLIEILAVVTIIGLIFILVIPKITTSLKNKKGDVDTTTNNIVLAAAKSYVADNRDKFDKEESNTYCLPISTLTKKEYLESPVKNVTDDVDITDTKTVKITYNKGFKYEIVDKKECSAVDLSSLGYTPVDYIESTGTQYIDTGVNAETGIICDLKAEYVSVAGNNSIISAYDGNNRFYCAHISNSDMKWTLGYGEYYLSNVKPQTNIVYNIKSSFLENEQKIIVDNNEIISKNITDKYNLNLSLYAFAMNKNGIADNYSSAKIYSLKLYLGDRLIRDYIPVIDENDIPCLFDKVEKKCYYNQGTGEFKRSYKFFGKYRRINYIQSTGTQYIDTGVNAETGIICDLKAEYVSVAGNNSIISAYDGNNRFYCAHISNPGMKWTLGYGEYYLSNVKPQRNIVYNIKSSFLENEQKIIVDNNEIISKNITDKYNLNLSLYAFAMNKNGIADNYSSAKIYSLKLYLDDRLIREYIPVVDENDTPCLFDKIENKCYYNQGTGEFLYG